MRKHLSSWVSPTQDGYSHVNISANGLTSLGRILCEHTQTPFTHPTYGNFVSLEGFRHWCKTGKKHEGLKSAWGVDAGIRGRKLPQIKNVNLTKDIVEGIHCKIKQTKDLHQQILDCPLPFTCYFVFSEELIPHKYGKILIKELDLIRAGKPLLFTGITESE